MEERLQAKNHIKEVDTFKDLVASPFEGDINAICWNRTLEGDFSEIVAKLDLNENIAVIDPELLLELQLTEQGQLAREVLLTDLNLLKAHGASPTLNLIKYYERDTTFPFFPTDVYSYHVDRSPVPTDTFLCTYFGEASDILPNEQAKQKIQVPELRAELKKNYHGKEQDFESYLTVHFFDLHYRAKPLANPVSLGKGHLWRLAVDHPESKVLPCIHRAPNEATQSRLLLIC